MARLLQFLLFTALSLASPNPMPKPQQYDTKPLPCRFSKYYCGFEIIENLSASPFSLASSISLSNYIPLFSSPVKAPFILITQNGIDTPLEFPEMAFGSRFCQAEPYACMRDCGVTGVCTCNRQCLESRWKCESGPDSYRFIGYCMKGCADGRCRE